MITDILIYLLKANCAIVLFALIYRFSSSGDTRLSARRLFLLLSVVVAFTFQFIPSPVVMEQSALISFIDIDYSELEGVGGAEVVAQESISIVTILLYLWGVVSVVLAMRLIYAISRVVAIRLNSSMEYSSEGRYYVNSGGSDAFSCFGWIFIPESQPIQSAILKHEEAHRRGLHSFDLMVAELLVIVMWFNPAAWYLRSQIKANLEYIADRAVLEGGFDRKEYQYGLLSQCEVEQKNIVATYFNSQKLKNRIKMMNKRKSSPQWWVKYGALPLVVLALSCANKPAPEVVVEGYKTENAMNVPDNVECYLDGEKVSQAELDKIPAKDILNVDVQKNDDGTSQINVTTIGDRLLIVDGKEVSKEEFDRVKLDGTVTNIEVLKGKIAIDKYGQSASQGAILIKTGEPQIEVKGSKGAISDANPLYIVDGKEVSKEEFSKIDVNSIAEVSVLKDASATAKYGDRASDGVVVVTLVK